MGRMHGRSSADRILGPCINTLPIRLRVAGVSVKDSVRQAHTLLAQILRHEHAPLGVVQRCSAINANVPLFSSILNYRRPSLGAGNEQTGAGSAAQKTYVNRGKAPAGSAWFCEEIGGREFISFVERTNYPLTLSVDDIGTSFRLVAQVQSPIDPQRVCYYMHRRWSSW